MIEGGFMNASDLTGLAELPLGYSLYDEINKALTAGGEVIAGSTGGGALKLESLDMTLKNLTFKYRDHCVVWADAAKSKAESTAEMHNVQKDYGDRQAEAFIPEIGLPNEADPTLERKVSIVKFMGKTAVVSIPSTLVRAMAGGIEAVQMNAATQWLIERSDHAMLYGRSDIMGEAYDGYFKLMMDGANADNLVDKRGKPILLDDLEDYGDLIAQNFGIPSLCWLNYSPHKDIAKQMFPKGRYEASAGGNLEGLGYQLKSFPSNAGEIRFRRSPFIKERFQVPPTTASLNAPPTSTDGSAATAVSSDTVLSKFGANDAGDYYYKVVARNKFGHSIALSLGPYTVTAGDKVTISVNNGGSGDTQPAYYEVYRSDKDGAATTCKLIGKFAWVDGTSDQYIDRNQWLPGTYDAMVVDFDSEQVLDYRQLAPLFRVPLATINTSIRWMLLLFGVPRLFNPNKAVYIRNIGKL